MLACVIVNDHHLLETLNAYRRTAKFSVFDAYVLTDNHSGAQEFQTLMQYQGPVTSVITTDRTGGAGYLANVGLRYAKFLGADYALLMEMDSEFRQEDVIKAVQFMDSHPEAVFAGPNWQDQEPGFRFTGPCAFVTHCLRWADQKFHPVSYSRDRFDEKHGSIRVDVLQGGCTLINLKLFEKMGWFDENPLFLHKEFAAGTKARLRGMKTYVLTECQCRKMSAQRKQVTGPEYSKETATMLMLSLGYYLKTYLHAEYAEYLLKAMKPLFYLDACLSAHQQSRMLE